MSFFTLVVALSLHHLQANGVERILTIPENAFKDSQLAHRLLFHQTHTKRRLTTQLLEHKQAILDRHNEARSELGQGQLEGFPQASNMKRLIWDDGLAFTAQSYAEQCIWGHSPANGRVPAYNTWQSNNPGQGITSVSSIGENLAITTGKGGTDDQQISRVLSLINGQWYNEWQDYDFDSNSCTAGEDCRHYTQMIWATTTHIGCGWYECNSHVTNTPTSGGWANGGTLLVCHYSSVGNIRGVQPYTEGNGCSECDSAGVCINGLCTNCVSENDCPDGLDDVSTPETPQPTSQTPNPTSPTPQPTDITPSPITSATQGVIPNSCTYEDVNTRWSGGRIAKVNDLSSVEECCQKCIENENCAKFRFRTSGGRCDLLANGNQVIQQSDGWQSGSQS